MQACCAATVARELTTSECWDLLDSVSLGRLLYTSAGLPLAQPTRFVVRNKVIMVSLDQSTATRLLPAGFEFVAFQVDDFADGAEIGRSVTVYGRARVVSHHRRDRAEAAGLPSHEGEAVYACVAPTHLCGSRLDLRTGTATSAAPDELVTEGGRTGGTPTPSAWSGGSPGSVR